MKKILAIILAVTFLLALVGCSRPTPSQTNNNSGKKRFNIEDDALKFENAEYETSVLTDSHEIYELLEDTLKGYVQSGGRIDGTDLSLTDCRPLFDRLPEVCEKITGSANHLKMYENAPYEQIMIFYFETHWDAKQYVELFVPWFKIVQYSKAPSKEYTFGHKGNIVYLCTTEAYDILMQNP
jgi:hypothetical protein